MRDAHSACSIRSRRARASTACQPPPQAPTAIDYGAVTPDDGALKGNGYGVAMTASTPPFTLNGAYTVEWWEKPVASDPLELNYYSNTSTGGSGANWSVQPQASGV